MKFASDAVARGQLPIVSRDDVKLEAPVPRPSKDYLHRVELSRPCERKRCRDTEIAADIFEIRHLCRRVEDRSCSRPAASKLISKPSSRSSSAGGRRTSISLRRDGPCFGYTNFNDVSARDMQFADGQWQRGKSCDTFAPFGEFVATKDEIPDPHSICGSSFV